MADVAVQSIAEFPRAAEPTRWSVLRKVVFRFFCCYWLLYALPEDGRVSIFQNFPKGETATSFYEKPWHAMCPWVAIHVFHLSGERTTYFPTGSGDTTLQYVQQLLFVVIALAATLVWSVLDRRRANYRGLHAWLRLLVRYTLSFTLLSYGFVKVFPLQFGPPPLIKLIEPYGEFSPMGVLWSFMGASIPYIIFSGSAEVLGGLLLLFRRTTTLGAMVSAAVMLNVAALNYCYDVPVKLYSTNLFLMAVWLLAPDLKRLANVLVFNRPAEPADLNPVRFDSVKLRRAATAFWVLFVGYQLYGQIQGGWEGYRQRYEVRERSPLYGLYEVESAGPTNWRNVSFEFKRAAGIRTSDDRTIYIATEYRDDTITLNKKDTVRWSRPDADHLLLEGTVNGGAAAALRLKKIDTSKIPLTSRGFHWINERPFNR